jgi:thioredoxin 2
MSASASLILACPSCATLNRAPADRIRSSEGRCGHCSAPLFDGAPVVLTAANFEAHATRSDLPLLVDFWAPWCGPCRQMAPAFAEAAARLEPMVRLGKLDTEAEPGFAQRFGIRSIPTLVLFAKGEEKARRSGAMPVSAIEAFARQSLSA